MLLRVPDYYDRFSCIADRCKDSCCIGWEIDIDEETCSAYKKVPGEFGSKLSKYLYVTPEGENSFRLAAKGRCPFLNDCNLCDIYTELGEEALSEVCTEYPRFSLEYGEVLQKCLSLSCEEVGRLVFSGESAVKIIEREIAGEADALCEEEEDEAEYIFGEDEQAWFSHMEELQRNAIDLLSNRKKPIKERMADYLKLLCTIAEEEVFEGESFFAEENLAEEAGPADQDERMAEGQEKSSGYEDFLARMQIFYEMETLGDEWRKVKADFRTCYTKENYETIQQEFQSSPSYLESDYEQLMVYFTFRYLMNAVYDYDPSSYARLAVIFTLVIRDMDALRYHLQKNCYSREDRIDVVRIFSKEVEHSQDNIDLVREECLFEEVFTMDALIRQIG